MNMLQRAKEWFAFLRGRAREEFHVKPLDSDRMDAFVRSCAAIYAGEPAWEDEERHIRTINFAKAICSETARLTMLGAEIDITGSARADWLKEQVDKIGPSLLRSWIEYGTSAGTVVFKPTDEGVDLVLPDHFVITDTDAGRITGAIFQTSEYDQEQERWFTRLEYHRFLNDGKYQITNRCFSGSSMDTAPRPVAIERTPWNGMLEEATIEGLDKPLFAVFKMPAANNVDIRSPLGMPIFSDAVRELEDLDIAYSRNAQEIIDSARLVLLDTDRLMLDGQRRTPYAIKRGRESIGLPDYVKTVEGNGSGAAEVFHEINPALNTQMRLIGINALLSQIGYKCGFSNGYFVFNEKSGMVTATQVEAEDRRTIQLILDIREQLKAAIDGLVYALDKFADLYDLAPVGAYEVAYNFQDITHNTEEDRARVYSYVVAGRFPFWRYLVEYEGYTEEDARAIEQEAQPPAQALFGTAPEE